MIWRSSLSRAGRFRRRPYPMRCCNCLRMFDLLASVREVSESQMHTEQQPQQVVTAPEIAPPNESKESKRGGKRPGAGRKPNLAKRLLKGFTRDVIAPAVQEIDVGAVTGLLKSKRERTRLEALVFLRDTLHGRPAQNVQLSGSMLHAHTVFRPLEKLTDEELRLLDSLTAESRDLACPARYPAKSNRIKASHRSGSGGV